MIYTREALHTWTDHPIALLAALLIIALLLLTRENPMRLILTNDDGTVIDTTDVTDAEWAEARRFPDAARGLLEELTVPAPQPNVVDQAAAEAHAFGWNHSQR